MKLSRTRHLIATGNAGVCAAKLDAYRKKWAEQGFEIPPIEISPPEKSPRNTIAKTAKPEAVPLNCKNRGELLREVTCRPCQGAQDAEIYACGVHGECTYRNGIRTNGMRGTIVHACKTCDEYVPCDHTEN